MRSSTALRLPARRGIALALLLLGAGLAQEPAVAPARAPAAALPAEWTRAFAWRSIGPANMAGRITGLAVCEADPSTYWVATASGGLIKTVNNGVTFEHQFDREATVSIGDVAVAPSDRNVVWVGTGEANPRNSVSWGDGVYKSTDGGKTWKNMGLKASFQVGKVLIHPRDPNVVYVGALGRLYGPNPERGLFKTSDGGKTWEKVLSVDDRTGVMDIVMHPADPETLIVATWERRRDGFDSWPGGTPPDGYDGYDPIRKWGPGSGLWKTTDGGKTFKRLTAGLPTCAMGRIGLDWYRKDPHVVFAVIDGEKIGMGTLPKGTPMVPFAGLEGEDSADPKGAAVTQVVADGPAGKAGLKAGDVVQKLNDKPIDTYQDLTRAIAGAKPDDKLKLTLTREGAEKELALTLGGRAAAPGSGFAGFQGEDAGDDKGARLTSITEGSPAERAGLKAGDVLTKIGTKSVRNYEEVVEATRAARPGDKVALAFTRDGEERALELTFGQRPGGAGGSGSSSPSATRPYRANLGGQRENVQGQQGPDSFQYGGVYRSGDGGETWTRINSVNPRPMYFSVVRVDPSDEKFLYILGVSLFTSNDGGKTFRANVRGIHADQHALWIDPKDGRHMLVGTDGGVYATYDRAANWDHLNHTAMGQFYHVAVCTKKPYWVYGGLQDNGSWGGPSASLRGGIGPINEDWISIGGGDGYRCAADPNDPDQIYFESQDGGMARIHLRTGERSSIRPVRPRGAPPYRFNWNTPYLLSHFNSKIYYCAGNVVFRSLNKGDDLRVISPEITLTPRGSATALAESPRNAEVLWVGSDDGGLWVTRNGGKEWTRLDPKVGLPAPRWVSTIEASRFADGRAYVAFDAHRSDDDEPYLYVTEDFGQTWKSLRGDLPVGSTRCLREDVENQNLLYAGTEFAVYASVDRGRSWTKLNNNLPTVAVHEIAVHPTAGEIVAATHGRSLWILDVTALRQLAPATLQEKPALYKPNTVVRWLTQPSRGRTNRRFVGQNPPAGAQIYYSLGKKADKVGLKVLDIDGAVVAQLTGPTQPGLHKVAWNLTRPASGPPRQGGGRGGPAPAGRPVAPGAYRVVLTVDGQELAQSLRIEGDPDAPPLRRNGEEEEDLDR